MPKFNVEFKLTRTSEFGSEVTQVKRVVETAVEASNLVNQACGADGLLEFLTVRRQPDVKPKPVALPKVGASK